MSERYEDWNFTPIDFMTSIRSVHPMDKFDAKNPWPMFALRPWWAIWRCGQPIYGGRMSA